MNKTYIVGYVRFQVHNNKTASVTLQCGLSLR